MKYIKFEIGEFSITFPKSLSKSLNVESEPLEKKLKDFETSGSSYSDSEDYIACKTKLDNTSDILINEVQVNILTSCIYCTSYELRIIFVERVMSYFLHTSYELLFIARVTSYFSHTIYELLFIPPVTSYFYCTSYELLFIARVTSYFLQTSYDLLFNYELQQR